MQRIFIGSKLLGSVVRSARMSGNTSVKSNNWSLYSIHKSGGNVFICFYFLEEVIRCSATSLFSIQYEHEYECESHYICPSASAPSWTGNLPFPWSHMFSCHRTVNMSTSTPFSSDREEIFCRPNNFTAIFVCLEKSSFSKLKAEKKKKGQFRHSS